MISKSNFLEVQTVLLAPLLNEFDNVFILSLNKSTLGVVLSKDFKMAAASIRCSMVYLPAIAIWKTPTTLPLSASS